MVEFVKVTKNLDVDSKQFLICMHMKKHSKTV